MAYLIDLYLMLVTTTTEYQVYTRLFESSPDALVILLERYQHLVQIKGFEILGPHLSFRHWLLSHAYGEKMANVVNAMYIAMAIDLELAKDIYVFILDTPPEKLRLYNLISKLDNETIDHIFKLMIDRYKDVLNSGPNENFVKYLFRCYPEISSNNQRQTIAFMINGLNKEDCAGIEKYLTSSTLEPKPASFPWGKVAMATVAVVVGGLAIASGLGWVSLGIVI